ncbi:MAG TPA: thiaminase II [Acidobacteriota bacterium]|nr:thiaminase II [Acidobacteriota bacterium]
MKRALIVLCFLGTAIGADGSFTGELWNANRDIYNRILEHPFLKELADGTLKRDAFAFYMIQDAHYLREFARALNITASKAPREDWAVLLSTHAADVLKSEKQLHESVFKAYGISEEQVASTEPAPEAFAYTSFLVANAHMGSFGESLAALLPCYWIYWEVGKELKKQGSKDPVYQRWIDAYSAEGFGESVKAVLSIINEVARQADPEQRRKMKEHFRRTSRYEWMFWDSAYHKRKWPPNN